MGHRSSPDAEAARAKLETATARRKLPVRKKPFYVTVSPGIALGYRRNIGGGSWSARCTGQGADWIKRIGLADDLEPADGKHVLTYWQAIDMARALARRQPGADDANRPVTVGEALDRYQRDLDSRGADAQNANRVRRHLTPTLATKPVALLTMNDLRHWRDGLVSKGVAPATINRTRAGLRAALELAASLDDRITNRNAFRSGLKGLPGGKNARRVVLPDADVLRSSRPHIKRIAPSACWSRYSRRPARASRRPRGCAAPICKLIERTRAC